MSHALAMVRLHLNNHNPVIRRIPSEILIMIVSHLETDASSITNVTQVCHRWRVTFLSCPSLWTHPNFARENQALSFLDRSKPFSIHVDLTMVPPFRSLINILCLHAERVQTLRIGHFIGLEALFRRPLASLRTLKVATSRNLLDIDPTAREFVALTSLTVEHNSGALAFRCPSITCLRIAISDLGSEVTGLPDLFRSCVLLEELEVEDRGKLEDGLPLPPDEVIPLPNLRSFTQVLHCDQHRAGIIDNLSFPVSCSVLLRCVVEPLIPYPCLDLPDIRNPPCNVKRVRVVQTEWRAIGRVGVAFSFINDRGTRFTAVTEFYSYAAGLSGVENPKTRETTVKTCGLEVLCVDGHRYVTLNDYKRLTTLILSGPVIPLYLKLLEEPELCNTCESLHTLVLFIYPYLFTSSLLGLLLETAQTRAEAGLSFRTVTFAYPSALKQGDLMVLEGLRGCVERVELLLGDDALDWNPDVYFLNGV